jgi:hypothetical protein
MQIWFSLEMKGFPALSVGIASFSVAVCFDPDPDPDFDFDFDFEKAGSIIGRGDDGK